MAIEKLAVKNLKKAVEPKNIEMDAVTELDPATTVAYEDSVEAAQHLEEVETALDKEAEAVVTPSPEAPEVKEKNIYTKLTLDESLDDFSVKINAKELSDESDEDDYLDYDMFDFVYGIVTDDWPRPKNPLGRPMRKFMHVGSDDYINTNSNTGVSQVSTDPDGNVVVYADGAAEFNDVKAVCDYYGISYDEPRASRNPSSRWKFSFKIYVPSTNGYPMMVEDFFADKGLTLQDVIEDHKVGGGKTANWGVTYERNTTKDRNDASKLVNDNAVQEIFQKHVRRAANSNDPLKRFIDDMITELTEKGLEFSKVKLKKEFNAEFEDDFEDEE